MKRVPILVACALATLHLACASAGTAPDRARVAGAISERAGVRADFTPRREWTAPPEISIERALTPNDAVAIALWNNPGFHAALTELGLARADLIEAGLLRNPVLSLLFPLGPKQLEATISWPVEALWQRPKRIAQARLNVEAVAERLVNTGLRLIADVKLAFVDVLAAERALAIAAEQAELARSVSDLSAGRLRAGDISAFDARLARTDAVRLEAIRLARNFDHRLAVGRLRALLGLGPDAPAIQLSRESSGSSGDCGALTDLRTRALAARPDVRAAELLVEAAGLRAGLERSRILTLTALLDMNGQGREGFEAGPGLGIELPVVSQNQGGRARAAAELERASRNYLAVRASTMAAVEEAWTMLESARGVAGILSDDISASLAADRQQAQRLYELGEISLLALLETRQRLIDVEQVRDEAIYGVMRAMIRLEQTVGRRCGDPR